MNTKKIIEALNITYDWIDYASDYFKEKHGWDADDKAIQEAIKEVETHKSCDGCKYKSDGMPDPVCWGCSRFFDVDLYEAGEPVNTQGEEEFYGVGELPEPEKRSCQTCKWLQDEVCTNADSPMVADYPNIEMVCMLWGQ